jgi:hypothetical protein
VVSRFLPARLRRVVLGGDVNPPWVASRHTRGGQV